MQNMAQWIGNDTHDEATQEVARVVELEPRRRTWRVRSGAGDVLEAERAASCLVAPCPGDLVLVARSRREGAFVIAVLRRASEDQATPLAVDGGLDIRVASGRLRLAAQDGVDVVSPRAVAISSGSLESPCRRGEGSDSSALLFVGVLVNAEIERMKLVASRFDSVLERVSQRIKRCYRTVEEVDRVRANRIDYRAEKTMSLHAEHALVTADELVKMDGDQIHLG